MLVFSELRLKDKHKPFHFAQLWDEFCAMYTDSKAEEISRGKIEFLIFSLIIYPSLWYTQACICLCIYITILETHISL